MAARKKPAEPVASVLPHNIPADEPRSTPPRAA